MKKEIKKALTEVTSVWRADNAQNLRTVLARHQNIPNFRLIILLSSSIVLNTKASNKVYGKKLTDGKKLNGGLTKDEQAILAVVKNQISAQDGVKNQVVAAKQDKADILSSLNPKLLMNPEISNLMLINTLASGMWNISAALLNKATNLDYQDIDGNTALHALAMTYANDEKKINEFLTLVERKYASQVPSLVGLSNNGGASALHFAAINNNAEMVRWLIENGADVLQRNNENLTALDIAARNNDTDIMLEILQAYSKKSMLGEKTTTSQMQALTTEKFSNIDINAIDIYGKTVMHYALESGSVGAVRYLIEKGAILHTFDSKGKAYMRYAIESGSVDMVRCLIDHGVEINSLDIYGKTVMHYAVESGSVDMVRCLIEKGARLNTIDSKGIRPLHYAAASGSVDMVRCLIDHGVMINSIDSKGKKALNYAVRSDSFDLIDYLVQNGADLNAVDAYRYTVLKDAIDYGSIDMVRYIINSGAIVNSVIDFSFHVGNNGERFRGWRHLDYAVFCKKIKLVELLLECNAVIDKVKSDDTQIAKLLDDVKDPNQFLLLGAKESDLTKVKIALGRGADINNMDDNNTALHYAVERGNLDLIKYLIEKQADINIVNSSNQTALRYAVDNIKVAVVELLLGHNAKTDGVTSANPKIAKLLKDSKAKNDSASFVGRVSKERGSKGEGMQKHVR
jgi:ankyrin repeat protein